MKDWQPEPAFASAEELEEVLGRVLARLGDDADSKGRFAALSVRQRYSFPDLDLSVQIRPAADGGIEWTFDGAQDWDCQFELTMHSGVANRYFQGAESAAIAIARKRITVSSRDYGAALRAFPGTARLIAGYSDLVRADYPHLLVGAGVTAQPSLA